MSVFKQGKLLNLPLKIDAGNTLYSISKKKKVSVHVNVTASDVLIKAEKHKRVRVSIHKSTRLTYDPTNTNTYSTKEHAGQQQR